LAKSKLNPNKDKPVAIYHQNHKALKRIAFQCEMAMEKLVNKLLEKDLEDKERLKRVLLELEIDPKCLEDMI
jgi:hypothetical protein